MKSAAILVKSKGYWSYDTILACDELNFYYLPVFDKIGEHIDLNPYCFEKKDHVDIIYVASHTWRYIIENNHQKEKSIVDNLRKHGTVLILIDGWDSFDLSIRPETIDQFDLVLKTNGVYHDKDLYNWRVGCDYANANWTEKLIPKDFTYTNDQLDKVKCSIPCFLATLPSVRNKLRRIKSNSGKLNLQNEYRFIAEAIFNIIVKNILQPLKKKGSKGVHFLGDLGHYQRFELLKILKENRIPGNYGVFRVLRKVAGIDNWRFNPLSEEEYNDIVSWVNDNGLVYEKKQRLLYLLEMLNHQIIISPTGYGELCFRHGEAMSMNRLLLCQDLTHVEIKYPFKNFENVVYVRPDLADLTEKIEYLNADVTRMEMISRKGYEDWKLWSASYQEVLKSSLILPLKEIK